ncbi:GspH/FimT family protein, partial [Immundisolibacter sp.]|uniref:GspH/FimT family protein n=1 Tax=Immundisolibacter sp. TaxID=1934948 RepID=UPI00260449D9
MVELIITLVVLGVLVALGVPAYTEFARNNRRAAVLNEFITSLALARSEAISRGLQVAVCKTADGTTCGGNGVHWKQGWLVFVNRDGDSPAVVDANKDPNKNELVLRVHREADPAFTLTPSNNFTNFVAYNPDGSSNNLGRFTYCEARDPRSARAVLINNTGR